MENMAPSGVIAAQPPDISIEGDIEYRAKRNDILQYHSVGDIAFIAFVNQQNYLDIGNDPEY